MEIQSFIIITVFVQYLYNKAAGIRSGVDDTDLPDKRLRSGLICPKDVVLVQLCKPRPYCRVLIKGKVFLLQGQSFSHCAVMNFDL